jgi:predicted permease
MAWRRFFRREKSDVELQQEIELYLEEEIAENRERGLPEDEARRQAYVKFGSPRRVREEIWRQNSISVAESFLRDLRHGFRRLVKSPSTVLTVVVSLGLGIAANVLIFTAVDKLLLQKSPVGDPATLLDLYPTTDHGLGYGRFTQQMYDDFREETKSFEGVAAYNAVLPGTMGGGEEPERVWGQSTTANFFEVAELPMKLGRGFANGEDRSAVVVLSYSLWRRHFKGDGAIVGKTVLLSGRMFTVVGVTMAGFHGINRLLDAEFWVPNGEREQLAGPQLNDLDARARGQLNVIARLKAGVSRAQAQVELDAEAKRFAAAYPKEDNGLGFHVEEAGALLPSQRANFGTLLSALAVVALLVLCIACSNVANLLLARAIAQHREMAVRTALGATRFQLIRLMVLESGLLALAGGVFGVILCIVGLRDLTIVHLPLAAPVDLNLAVDLRVLLYAFLLSVGAGILCGIGPAFVASRPALPNSLKGESTLDRPGRRWSLRNVLVVVQISLCVVLLCTTGLFLRSLGKSAEVDPGFRTTGVLMLSIDPAHNGYTMEQMSLLLRRLHDGVAALPGVTSAAWTDKVPLSFYGQGGKFHETGSKLGQEDGVRTELYDVQPGYLDTMGIRWIAGRDLNHTDPNAPKQVVVNKTFVQSMFGGRSAVGHYVTSADKTYEIVGVVEDTKSTIISETNEPIVYRVLEQDIGAASPVMGFSLMVRYTGNAAELTAAIRREVHDLDPQLVIFSEKTMEEHLSDALILPKVAAVVFSIFGAAGLLLASVGLYGVMSYAVNSRTREIGIRLALGATHRGVQRLIVGQGMVLSLIALTIGLPIAMGAAKIAAKALYGIAPRDLMTFTVVPCFLAGVALVTCWLPARRAASVEPQTALRHE